MNIRVRLRNPAFWMGIIPAVLTLVYTILSALDIAPSISESDAVNIVTVIVAMLTTIGVLVDPTTKGIGDSDRAMEYETPAE